MSPVSVRNTPCRSSLRASHKEELENLDQKWKRCQIATPLATKAAKVNLQNPIDTVSGVLLKLTKKDRHTAF